MSLEKEFIVLTGKVYQGFLNIFAEIGSDNFTNFA
jgi:predicted NAD/FAD-binding protein